MKLSRTRTEALLYCFASAFVPISDENRDGGRAFPRTARAKPTPYRGSGPHSPPRWRTRGRRSDLSLPLQEKSDSGNMSGQLTARGLGDQRPRLQPDRATPTLPPSRHTDRSVLAQPSNNSKKSGWGQCILPHPSKSFGFIRSSAASRRRFQRQSRHDAWLPAC